MEFNNRLGNFAPNNFEPVRVGSVHYIASHQVTGAEVRAKMGRPAVILFNDRATATIAYLTSTVIRKRENESELLYPHHYQLTSSKYAGSIVKLGQITTVDMSIVGDYAGEISTDDHREIYRIIGDILRPSFISSIEGKTITLSPPKPQMLDFAKEVECAKLEAERDLYRRLYEELVQKVMK